MTDGLVMAERAPRNPRLAWALIAERVGPRADAERLAYRKRRAQLFGQGLTAVIVSVVSALQAFVRRAVGAAT